MRIDGDTASELLDMGPQVIATPPPESVRLRDPDALMSRLANMESPNQRLAHFVASIFDVSGTSTHEGHWVRTMTLYGTLFGWLFGGLAKMSAHHETFVRTQNAAVFDNPHVASRLMVDKYVYGFITKGAKPGLAVGLLCGSAGVISLGSVNYRNKLYLPDWLVGFTTLGSLSRCWLGARGVVAGGAMGAAAGLLGYGCAKSYETLTGESVTYIRTLHHLEWKRKQEEKLQLLRYNAERNLKENPRFKQ